MTQHTPAPWNVAKPNCGLGIFDANGKSVAAISSTQKRPNEEKEANARLIAAAPKLLNELKAMVLNFETDGASDSHGEVSFSRARLARVKDLIAEAEGA